MKLNPHVKKGLIIERLLKDVVEYYATFGKPITLKILAAKYGKTLETCGGFRETIDQLDFEGAIKITLKETGGKLIYPSENFKMPEVG